MQQRLQTTPERNTSISSKAFNEIIANREKDAPGLASLEGAWTVIGALRKFFNVLLVGFWHFLRLYLELLLGLLGYDDWVLGLRSCMMQCV